MQALDSLYFDKRMGKSGPLQLETELTSENPRIELLEQVSRLMRMMVEVLSQMATNDIDTSESRISSEDITN